MNKLTKMGVSALCGSLAVVSAANAGEMAVSGGANATWTKLSQGTTGNSLGMASNLTFTGSGELDNGNAFTLSVAHTDQNAYTASQIAYTTSMGTFTLDQGGGTGLDRIDDMMPTAWEETDGTGVTAGLNTVSGAGGSTDIEWTVSSDMLPDGLTAHVAWSPKPDGSKNNDKSVSGAGSDAVDGAGYDVVLIHTGLADGLKAFAGYGVIAKTASAGANGFTSDNTQYSFGATYAVGSVTVGYQYSRNNIQDADDQATRFYENNAYGISFNVNDDLSISYGVHKSDRALNGASSVELDGESLQMAYSMGGATLKIAETSIDNAEYVSTSKNEGTTVMLSLAF
jgi:hypothetical protein